jgi:hypothetical protein
MEHFLFKITQIFHLTYEKNVESHCPPHLNEQPQSNGVFVTSLASVHVC